jgi:hypothetical protein
VESIAKAEHQLHVRDYFQQGAGKLEDKLQFGGVQTGLLHRHGMISPLRIGE